MVNLIDLVANPCVGGIQELCVRVLDEDECDRTYCKRRDLMDLALSRNKTTFECLTYQERCVEAYHCRCENATDVFDLDGNCVEKRVSHSCQFSNVLTEFLLDQHKKVPVNRQIGAFKSYFYLWKRTATIWRLLY